MRNVRDVKFRLGWKVLKSIDKPIDPNGPRVWVFHIFTLDQLIGSASELMDYKTCDEFTGLVDRNGKEIYEGDIVIHRDHRPPFKMVVEWHQDSPRMILTHKGKEMMCQLWNNEYEIVGNIHETGD